jgi:hypothetical protein
MQLGRIFRLLFSLAMLIGPHLVGSMRWWLIFVNNLCPVLLMLWNIVRMLDIVLWLVTLNGRQMRWEGRQERRFERKQEAN